MFAWCTCFRESGEQEDPNDATLMGVGLPAKQQAPRFLSTGRANSEAELFYEGVKAIKHLFLYTTQNERNRIMAQMRELADQSDFAFITNRRRYQQLESELVEAMTQIRTRGLRFKRGTKVLPLTNSQTEFVAAMRCVIDDRQKVKYLIEAEECRSMGLLDEMDNDEKLQFYAYFKQGYRGDVCKRKPANFELVKLAKWNAWRSVLGMKREEARLACIEYVARMKAQYGWRRPSAPLPPGALCPSSAIEAERSNARASVPQQRTPVPAAPPPPQKAPSTPRTTTPRTAVAASTPRDHAPSPGPLWSIWATFKGDDKPLASPPYALDHPILAPPPSNSRFIPLAAVPPPPSTPPSTPKNARNAPPPPPSRRSGAETHLYGRPQHSRVLSAGSAGDIYATMRQSGGAQCSPAGDIHRTARQSGPAADIYMTMRRNGGPGNPAVAAGNGQGGSLYQTVKQRPSTGLGGTIGRTADRVEAGTLTLFRVMDELTRPDPPRRKDPIVPAAMAV